MKRRTLETKRIPMMLQLFAEGGNTSGADGSDGAGGAGTDGSGGDNQPFF